MTLRRVEYSEFEDRPNSWYLKPSELELINLLVGKNSSGKSRTINVINSIGNLLSGNLPQLFESGRYIVEWEFEGKIYLYELELHNMNVLSETLTIDEAEVLTRSSDGLCSIWAEQLQNHMTIKIPRNHLVVVMRRDEIQHPFLDPIFNWATSVRFYPFGTSLGRENGLVMLDPSNIPVNERDINQVAGMLARAIHTYGIKFKESVIADMHEIGYNISDIGIGAHPFQSFPVPGGFAIQLIYVQEIGLNFPTFQSEMSQGMFRVLSLIVQLSYSRLLSHPTTILIDDIGEGLDFDRSTRLIALLAKKANEDGFQIIMSTNDKFVMNHVELKYWQVVKRIGNVVKLINQKNSAEIFADFEFTGLTNFDFFHSEFFDKGFTKE